MRDAAPPRSIGMKLLVVALVVALAGALLVANGNITFGYSSASGDSPVASSDGPRSPTVRDVFAVIDAATLDAADLDNAQINALVAHVAATRDRTSTRLLQRELPQLSRRLDRKAQVLYARVARSPVTTRVGAKCRDTALRFLARQRRVFRRFAHQVARDGATPAAVDRFAARVGRVSTWYANQLRVCTAGATPDDRAAIEAALTG
jgi:hypothetical protein